MHDQLWYKNCIIYGIDIRKFQDSNGDGIGDIQGLISRLPYLRELGVNCLWLLPFFVSPFRDNGYDVVNYYDIAPEIGTIEEFITLVHTAGEMGMSIIIDCVMNHTSDQHPWFIAAREDTRSKFHDYYVWSAQPPLKAVENSFPGEATSTWHYDEKAKKYYYHHFYPFQPQLKYSNPDVLREALKVLDFWMSLGVTGFRIDAASQIVESMNLNGNIPHSPHHALKAMRRLLEEREIPAFLIGESDVKVTELEQYFGDNDELTSLLNFLLNNYMFHALAEEKKESIEFCLGLMPSVPSTGNWVNFLRNLDELNLSQLSDNSKHRTLEYFDPDHKARIYNRGLRRRLAPLLRNDRRKIRMAFSLLFSMPGSPMIVYGDEIGLGDDLTQPGREAVRVPMQWSGDCHGGFTNNESIPLRMLRDGTYGYEMVNVKQQEADNGSLLHWIQDLIRVRHNCPELWWGPVNVLSTNTSAVLAHRCEWKGGHLMFIHNLSGEPVNAAIDLSHQWHGSLHHLFGEALYTLDKDNHLNVSLAPYGYQWIREDKKGFTP